MSNQLQSLNRIVVSVQPEWCLLLPVQQQSVLLIAARGPDGINKLHPCKAVHRAYRACILVAARKGRMLQWGESTGDSFMSLASFSNKNSWAEDVDDFFRGVDSLPHHYYQHLMLGAEILGYKHPDSRFRERWYGFYLRCVENLHLNPETEEEINSRLCDWNREGWNNGN